MFDQHLALPLGMLLGQSTVETSLLVAALLAAVIKKSAYVIVDSTVQRQSESTYMSHSKLTARCEHSGAQQCSAAYLTNSGTVVHTTAFIYMYCCISNSDQALALPPHCVTSTLQQ
jgi:hypothetical protein